MWHTDAAVASFFDELPAKTAFDAILERANYATKRPNQHINWFTGDKLINLVKEAGFEFAIRTSYGQSISPLMRNKAYFDQTRPNELIYVDGFKAHPDIRLPR